MSDFIDQFFGDAKQLKLTGTERAALFGALKMHTKKKPVSEFSEPETVVLSSSEKDAVFGNVLLHMRRNPIEHRQSAFAGVQSYFSLHRMTAGALSVALLFGVGGGVTYAAEDAMPDDVLYPVKLHFNEPLIEAMQRTPKKKAEWEARLVERRLREAEHVVGNEQLAEQHEERIRMHIEQRMEHLSSVLEELPEEAKEQLTERIDMQLQKHQEFLQRIEDGQVGPPPHVKEFREGIGEMRNKFTSKFRRPPPDNAQARPVVPRTLSGAQLRQQVPTKVMRPNSEEILEERLPDTLQFPPQEGWLSGRKRTTRNRVDEQSSRGFESPSLRHPTPLSAPPRWNEIIPELGEAAGEDGSLRQEEEVIPPRKPNVAEPENDDAKPQNEDTGKDIRRLPPPILRSKHPFFQRDARGVPTP